MKKALQFSGKVGVLASEEEDTPVPVGSNIKDKYAEIGLRTTQFKSDVVLEEIKGGKYIAVFDPLDGSSNVDAGIPTGTIFGVFSQDDNDVRRLLHSLFPTTLTPHVMHRSVSWRMRMAMPSLNVW